MTVERMYYAALTREQIEKGEKEYGREYEVLGVRCRNVYWIVRDEEGIVIRRIRIGIQTFESDGMWHYV